MSIKKNFRKKLIKIIPKIYILFFLTFTQWVYADSLAMKLNGNLYPSTCNLQTNQLTVELPPVPQSDLMEPNSGGPYKAFSFTLTDCPPLYKTILLAFQGRPDPAGTDRLYWNEANVKFHTNVQIELMSQNDLPLGDGKTLSVNIDPNTHQAIVNLKTRLFSLKGNAFANDPLAYVNIFFTYP